MHADPFLAAIRGGEDTSAIEAALRAEPALAQLRDGNGVSVVCLAAYGARWGVARLLCRERDDLDIFEASAVGDSARVATLVRGRPELVNAYSPDGFHPLGYACFLGHAELFEFLLAHGPDLEAPAHNAMEVRPIHGPVAHADPAVAQFLTVR